MEEKRGYKNPLSLLVFFVASIIPVGIFMIGVYAVVPPFYGIWAAIGNILFGVFLIGLSIILEIAWAYWWLLDKNIKIEDREY